MYQDFSSLQGHLHFFVHFFFTFMEHFFIVHPIYWVSPKKLSFGIFSIIKTTSDKNFFTVEITDSGLPLNKPRRYLVDVKIVKIRHLIGYISYLNQNMKNIFL